MLEILFYLVILLFSVVIHEVAHGSVAYALGDPTAKYQGRLTLNPLRHLDPMGSFLFPLLMFLLTLGQGPIFGWARPVPINPHNFKDLRWDNVKVAMAGPASNLLVALFFGILIRFFHLPVSLFFSFSAIVIVNLFLALFNLFPIPPLDGSHILFGLLPASAWRLKMMLSQYGLLILFLVIFFGLSFLGPLVFKLYQLITGFSWP